jgi:hypothetical protein
MKTIKVGNSGIILAVGLPHEFFRHFGVRRVLTQQLALMAIAFNLGASAWLCATSILHNQRVMALGSLFVFFATVNVIPMLSRQIQADRVGVSAYGVDDEDDDDSYLPGDYDEDHEGEEGEEDDDESYYEEDEDGYIPGNYDDEGD